MPISIPVVHAFYSYFCLGTEVPRHSAGSVSMFDHMLIVFITNDAVLRMLQYISHVLQNREFLVFKDVVRLVYTHYKVQVTRYGYTVVYTSTRCLAHDVTHSISLLSSFALRAYKTVIHIFAQYRYFE